MTPEQKTEVVAVVKTYWTCAQPAHRHMSEEVARKCLEKHSRRKSMPPIARPRGVVVDMFRAVAEGETMAAVGRAHGITGQRVRQILSKEMRRSRCSWNAGEYDPTQDATPCQQRARHYLRHTGQEARLA